MRVAMSIHASLTLLKDVVTATRPSSTLPYSVILRTIIQGTVRLGGWAAIPTSQ